MIRINFKPYSSVQLEQIVKSRLANAKEGLKSSNDKDVIAPDGVKFAAMKVSSITGDARRVLDICRSAYLRDCSFHERLMLASMIKCMKREGVEEIKWNEVCIIIALVPRRALSHSSC